jgi:DNA repair exonuclease SbcCD ATPase subunit
LFLDEIAASFNANRARVIPTITDGLYDVQFSTISRTAAGESREKTEFIVTDEDGNVVDYNTLSGGQRRRIDLAVILTLNIAVSKAYQINGVLGLLVLDEVFDFIDEGGVEPVVSALQEVAKVVPTILVITHDKSMQDMFPNVIKVVQDENKISRIAA